MIKTDLSTLIFLSGVLHFTIFIAQGLVPLRLDWRSALSGLPLLHRQMFLTYGGYIVLSTGAFGVISIVNAHELVSGSMLARSFCLFVAVFWGVRVLLQFVFDAKMYLTLWWLKVGYHILTLLFLFFTLVYGYVGFMT